MITVSLPKLQPGLKQSWLWSFVDKTFDYLDRNIRCLTQKPGLFLVRKLGRIELLRDGLFHLSKASKPAFQVPPRQASVFQGVNVEYAVETLKKEGYFAGIRIPDFLLQDLLNYADTELCLGDRDPNLKFRYADRAVVEANLDRRFLCCSYETKTSAAIHQIIHDPTILEIAARFLEAPPLCIGIDLLWSLPTAQTWEHQRSMAQVFHYDLDDFRSLKFFFYLNDVDALNGPHLCIRQSHRGKKFLHQILGQRCASLPDTKIIESYGSENVISVQGKAGFGFAEDPCCFHKGAPPTAKERLLLQIQYAVNDYGNIRAFRGV